MKTGLWVPAGKRLKKNVWNRTSFERYGSLAHLTDLNELGAKIYNIREYVAILGSAYLAKSSAFVYVSLNFKNLQTGTFFVTRNVLGPEQINILNLVTLALKRALS